MSHEEGPAAELVACFERRGFVRRQRADRLHDEGPRRYKKGDEIRLDALSVAEAERLRALLLACGFRPGKPYAHGKHRIRQPVYGRDQVARFLEVVERVRGGDDASV